METTFSKHALAYDRYALVQLFKAIEEFRGVDPEMPAQGIVARKPRLSFRRSKIREIPALKPWKPSAVETVAPSW